MKQEITVRVEEIMEAVQERVEPRGQPNYSHATWEFQEQAYMEQHSK